MNFELWLPTMAKQPALLLSLQTQCLTHILHYLDDYPRELLSLLPTRQRKELMMSLPPLDICKLEDSDVANGVDMNEVWKVVCELYDDTANIRVTGNGNFDKRYLNYRNKVESSFFDCDAKIKGDWRAHFIIRTGQVLLHSFDPSSLSVALVHSDGCDCAVDPEQECDCWGNGLDPTHQVFLQRLMSVPPHSNIAKCFLELEQRSVHFKEVGGVEHERHLLIPFRYAKYFDVNYKASVLDLLTMFVKKCHFQPKILPVHCEFMFHSELYQLHLHGRGEEEAPRDAAARSLFAEFLAKLEQVEFYWVGGMKGANTDGEMTYAANPSIHIPKLFLEAILSNPSTNLDTICIKMYSSDIHSFYLPSLDSCLNDISAFFSTSHSSAAKGKPLPIGHTPYKGLKRIHLFGAIHSIEAGEIIPSIILHQTSIEGLEIRCVSRTVSPVSILDPIAGIFPQSQFQFFVLHRWKFASRKDYLKDVFYQFLDANRSHEIRASSLGHEIVIPALTPDSNASPRMKVLRFFSHVSDTSHLGIFFAWLHEADKNVALRSIRISSPLHGHSEECLLSHLSTCEALTFDIKGGFQMPSEYLNQISKNGNLQVLKINNCSSFVLLVDDFCKMLSAVSANLKEFSFQNNNMHNLPGEKLKFFFKTLLTFPSLEELSVDLRWNHLREGELDLLLKVWRGVAVEKKLKSLALDSSSYEDKVMEMVLE